MSFKQTKEGTIIIECKRVCVGGDANSPISCGSWTRSAKWRTNSGDGTVALLVEYLPNLQEVLGLIPSTIIPALRRRRMGTGGSNQFRVKVSQNKNKAENKC